MIDETEVTYDSYLEHVSGIQAAGQRRIYWPSLTSWRCGYVRICVCGRGALIWGSSSFIDCSRLDP